jgi:antitoxin component of MazEF toxin-antitoxin module
MLVRVRRDGNSLAVTIPADEARALQIEEGMYVNVELDASGNSIQVQPVTLTRRGRPEVLAAGKRVLEKNRGLYKRLAAHDQGPD